MMSEILLPPDAPEPESAKENTQPMRRVQDERNTSPRADSQNVHSYSTIVRPDVGIWGAKESGKTMLLAAAIQMLRNRVGYRTSSDDHHYRKYLVEVDQSDPNVDVAKGFMRNVLTPLGQGLAPGGTAPMGKFDGQPFSLELSYPDNKYSGRLGRFYRIRLMDVAGENISDEERSPAFWNSLRAARGIMLVIDIESRTRKFNTHLAGGGQNIDELIENFVLAMKGNEGLRGKFVSVCVTKCDKRFDDIVNVPRTFKERQDTLRNILGQIAYNRLIGALRDDASDELRYNIFFTSAVGWYRDSDKERFRPNVDYSEDPPRIRNVDRWKSFEASWSLLWLLDRIDNQKMVQSRPGWLRWLTARNRVTNGQMLTASFGGAYRP